MSKLTKKILGLPLIFSIIIGIIASGIMMYIAWDHNASEEIHSSAAIHWGYWFQIGFLWFAPATALSFILLALFLSAFVRDKSS